MYLLVKNNPAQKLQMHNKSVVFCDIKFLEACWSSLFFMVVFLLENYFFPIIWFIKENVIIKNPTEEDSLMEVI